MKVLTAAQMREVDHRTAELGIPSLILMENAGSRIVDFLVERFAPLSQHRILICCGKGNNGGDGLVAARQIYTRFKPEALDVVTRREEDYGGDAQTAYRMLAGCGCPIRDDLPEAASAATLVIDAILGTGLTGPAKEPALSLIRSINSSCPRAKVVAVDTPSGLHSEGEFVRADYTVTFTAPKVEHVVPPSCDWVGELTVAQIGSPAHIWNNDPTCWLHLTEPCEFRHLLAPRNRGAHKGDFGHVLVIGGAQGKGGAAAMSGLAALRAGAGLVTVATSDEERRTVTAFAPELMTAPVGGELQGKDVLAIGPGLGCDPGWITLVRDLFAQTSQPMVIDADGLNALAGTDFQGPEPARILTPHPGEMSRLTGLPVREIQANRIDTARSFAQARNVILVLKGQRTVVALPDGRVWINPKGSPAMATAGSGDILTGLIAGMIAQFPNEIHTAVLAAVWLHGRAGEIGARRLGEPSLIATDILRFWPGALREAKRISNHF